MKRVIFIYVNVLFLLLINNLWADPSLPEEGIRAEMNNEWDRAVTIYRNILRQAPERTDLDLRIADIEALRGNADSAAASLREAAEKSPNDATLQFKLGQAYSMANKPDLAYQSFEKAVKLDPDDVEYLSALAQIANWLGNPEVAVKSYKRILELNPDDDTSLLYLIRSQSWTGELDKSVEGYKKYVKKHPMNKEALMEYAKVESWCGNFAKALETLEIYKNKFGDTYEYYKMKVRFLASANRPNKALSIIDELLEKYPNDFELNYSRTIALNYANRPREALESLDILRRLSPESQYYEQINWIIKTSLQSNISSDFYYYKDSDRLTQKHYSIIGEYVFRPETRLRVGGEINDLGARLGSGLETIEMKKDIEHYYYWMGLKHRFSPHLSIDGRTGQSSAQLNHKATAYNVGIDFKPADELKVRLEKEYGFYVISPRTLSLDIRKNVNRLNITWEPTLRFTMAANGSYESLSDDNKRWESIAAPRIAVMRKQKWNLDMGLTALLFGFDKNFDNGYYDPKLYERYTATGYIYRKINYNSGISAVLNLGAHKDETYDNYKFSGSVDVEATAGAYYDWMLKLRGSYIYNVQPSSQIFRAGLVSLSITRSF